MKVNERAWFNPLLAAGLGILLGLLLAVFSPGEFLSGLWRSTLFCIILSGLFYLAYRYVNPPRAILVIAVAAFLLRIGVGTWLSNALPEIGFDTPVQNAGYVYADAYERDQFSYVSAFPERWEGPEKPSDQGIDQYGGLTAISKAVYRVFSSDAHRPLLIVYLSAFFMGVGMLFFWSAVNAGWGKRIALIACLVMALYPEGVLLGSSQMREPLLIGLASATLWMTLLFSKGDRHFWRIVSFIAASLFTCWISIPGGLVILLVEAGYFLVALIIAEQSPRKKKFLWGIFFLMLSVSILAGWWWLKDTLYYDAYTTEQESGLIAALLDIVGDKLRFPFVLLYGLIQPLLPAALVYPSLPVWQGIAIFRASGWYVVIPFLVYGFGAIFKSAIKSKDWGLFWLMAMLVVWVFVSSARAGGDLWDNPRYRAIFLPWFAIIVGWVWDHLGQMKALWFWRIVALESLFVIVFTNWYINRKFGTGIHIEVQYLLVFCLTVGLGTIIGGLIVDHQNKRKAQSP